MRSIRLVGGVVAYNEERRIGTALTSLLSQELPSDARWEAIWVVASGCTDGTAAVARAIAAKDERITVLIQSERRGKASALREIFREAQGDYLVLLNADARAEPGAVAELVRTARTLGPPFAVMGRPVPPRTTGTGFGRGVDLLWELHHLLHQDLIQSGLGTHLSDELLLLPLPELPPLPEGVVNDGAYIGAWLSRVGGHLAYAPGARATIDVPSSLADHIRQRRRIHFGHIQVKESVGIAPSTLGRYMLENPGAGLALLRKAVRRSPHGALHLAWLVLAEVGALAFAGWDQLPPRRDHRLWEPIRDAAESPEQTPPPVDRTSRSLRPSDRSG